MTDTKLTSKYFSDTAVIVGGMDMVTQAVMLGKKPHVVIG
jgi:superfamily II DNA/RNA helicase